MRMVQPTGEVLVSSRTPRGLESQQEVAAERSGVGSSGTKSRGTGARVRQFDRGQLFSLGFNTDVLVGKKKKRGRARNNCIFIFEEYF